LVYFVGFLSFGTLIGGIVGMLVAEKAGRLGVSMLSGAFGALAGGFLGRWGELHNELDSGGFVAALLGAFASVALYHSVAAVRRGHAQ
jgi:uncharacterized membrane protein YeaQ/YmgE (transglycosylase-associated protein family)